MEVLKEWFVTFWRIASRPRSDTFIEVAAYAPGKFPSAIAGLALTGVCAFALSQYVTHGGLLYETLFVVVIAMPISVLVWVVCINLFYTRMFHRKRDHFEEMLYLTAAIYILALF